MTQGVKGSTVIRDCAVEGCSRTAHTRGLCAAHYARLRIEGDVLAHKPIRRRIAPVSPECTAKGCSRKPDARGLCKKHYSRWRVRGSSETVLLAQPRTEDERLEIVLSRIDKSGPVSIYVSTPCWLWSGYTNAQGYAKFGPRLVHRYVYEHLVGPLGRLTLDHVCRVRRCINPEHMSPMPISENNSRRHAAYRDRCPNPICEYHRGFPLRGATGTDSRQG